MSLLSDHNSESPRPVAAGKRYWRSLDELANTPQFEQFLHREFPEQASEMISPFSRRTFLNLMAASVALAGGLTGCRRPVQKIHPYTNRPEALVPGVPQFYATAVQRPGGGEVLGLLVKSHEGRPMKVEGNPGHPANAGAADGQTQALILELYDPDRSAWPTRQGQRSTAEAFDTFFKTHAAGLRERKGRGLAILSERVASPTLRDVRRRVSDALPETQWFQWEPVNFDASVQGTVLAFGQPLRAAHDLSNVDVLVAIESDFLFMGENALRHARQFASRRNVDVPGSRMNRLYAAEGTYSLTGAMADHRLRVAPSQAAAFTLALAAELVFGQRLLPETHPLAAVLQPHRDHAFEARWVRESARDLAENRGRALILAGPSLPAPVQAIVHVLNVELGGANAQFNPVPANEAIPGTDAMQKLVAQLQSGAIETLVILGGNPVYDAPADLDFAGALAKAAHSIHLGLYENETGVMCSWHLPRAHAFESWGDLEGSDGTIAMVQPLIAPLYDGRTDTELLAQLGDLPQSRAYDLLRSYHQGTASEAEFDGPWRKMLHDGIARGPVAPPLPVPADGAALAAAVGGLTLPPAPSQEALELVFHADPALFDGRFANNGWLQETPDPVTKLTWDNAALIGLTTARALGLEREDLVTVQAGERSVKLPVWIVPGMADWTVAVQLGYGRDRAGRIAEGAGVDVYPLRTLAGQHGLSAVTVGKTGLRYELACVQDHWAIEGRELIREASVNGDGKTEHVHFVSAEEHAAAPAHGAGDEAPHGGDHGEKAGHATPRLWTAPQSFTEGPQWGMTIDLSACIGCNACMVACQSENNVPIVGKREVMRGREMHWIRIDRYFAVTAEELQAHPDEAYGQVGYANDAAEMVFQPMPCQQCENAPCEQVCPVAATVHSASGLNEMTYNRCIGTRYCSNNCPFKVRRFNFFNYHDASRNPIYQNINASGKELLKMASNPDVTVRSRGVMEKCTFCVQRLNRATRAARQESRPLRDGEAVTACQQTCPSQAIQFGDILDAQSKVAQAKKLERNYTLLDELFVKPRTSYLSKMRNPNPNLIA